jgi:hypothetical protein
MLSEIKKLMDVGKLKEAETRYLEELEKDPDHN